MTIRTTKLGGTNWTDGEVLYAADLNDTFGAAGQIIAVESGEDITLGNAVYIHLTDGKAYVSGTGTADDIRANGIALETVTSGADVLVITRGVYYTSGLSDKEDYYLGAAGAISTTRSGVRIGTALSTTQLFVNIIQDDRDAVGIVKSYMKSQTGVPANNMTAFWQECDGAAISDAESPLNGQNTPDLVFTTSDQDGSILLGRSTSGTTISQYIADAGAPNPEYQFYTTVFIIKKK